MGSPPPTTTSAAQQEWEKFVDDETKTPYYYNACTGETSWEMPEGFTEPKDTAASEGESAKPPKWKRFFDKDTGKPYYYDEANDVTQWDEPEGDVEDGSDSEEEEDDSDDEDNHESAKQSSTQDDKSSDEVSDSATSEAEPKANWVKHIDRSTGKPYYHDTVSNTTQWEQPEHFTEAATPAPVSAEYLEYLHRSRAEKLAQATQRALDPEGNLSRLNALLSKIDNNGASAVPVDDAGVEDVKELVATVQERSKAEWQQHVDPQTHKYYYHNIVTGETQWQKPDAPIASALADWIPPETTEDTPSQKPAPMVSGQHYAATAKFNRLTGRFEKLGGEDYWQAMGVAADREGRQMSHFFDVSQLEKNRQDAQRIKEELKRKNIDWKKVAAEKKAKKQKRKNEWIYND